MSSQKEEVEKLEIKDVYIDFPSALLKIGLETGKKKLLGSVHKECDVSVVIVKQWETKAPNIVAILNAFMKKYGLSWDELVKEVESKK